MTLNLSGSNGISGVDGSAGTPALQGTDANTGISFPAADTVAINTGGSERTRVDSSGRLLVGTSSASGAGLLQVQGQPGNPTLAGVIDMRRGSTNPSSGTDLGYIRFGDSAESFAAHISCVSDGTWGSNDYPGRLVFSTTADGASSPTERMRIANDNNIYVFKTFRPWDDNVQSLGVATGRWTAVYAANGTIQTSDKREKTEIATASLGAEFIKSLRPVSYKWIEGGKRDTGKVDDNTHTIYESVPGKRTHWGFLAQEVKQAVDAAGVDFGGWVLTDKDDPDSQQALRYDQFIAPLTKALQEALEKIETLEAKVAALEAS